jgi:hypothetical protein
MIRKLKSGGYRLYSRKKNPRTGKRRNLGTFKSLAAAKKHVRAVQFFKRRGYGYASRRDKAYSSRTGGALGLKATRRALSLR